MGSEMCIRDRPNSLVAPLHDRMPVIIPEGLESIWLEPGDGAHRRALEPMLTPAPAGKSEAHGGNHSAEQQELQLGVIPPQEPLNQSHQHLGHCRCPQVRQ